MQRVLSIYDWQKLPKNERAVFQSDVIGQRLVRLRVNAPNRVAVYLNLPDLVDPVFVATVHGLDEIQFYVEGDYKLSAIGGELWFDTLDGTRPDVEPVEPDSFTSIVERRQRNPELELLERKMHENMERRMNYLTALMTEELEQKEAEFVARRKAAAVVDRSEPASASDQKPSDTSASEVAAGTGGVSDDKL